MKAHPPVKVVVVPARPGLGPHREGRSPDDPGGLGAMAAYWSALPHVHVDWRAELPDDLGGADVVVTEGGDLDEPALSAVERFVRSGGGWLAFVDERDDRLPSLLGVQPVPLLTAAEVRVRLARPADPLVVRLPDEIYIRGPFRAFDDAVAGDVEVVARADWQYRRLPVLVRRAVADGQAACTTLGGIESLDVQQLLYRVLRALAGQPLDPVPLRVGLVGYPPSVGRVHGDGIGATQGLELRVVADLDGERRAQAKRDYPGIQVLASGEGIAGHPEVDLAIVTTPPDSHARLSLQMLAAGKHVVCEKPLALTTAETDAMAAQATARGLHLGCHQNRRWDVDYRAIRRARDEDLLGDLFHIETFVGGFSHPCGQWHSHAPVSGGTAYDWGAHYLDWIVSLIPVRIVGVTGTSQKRVWHDVTNADQVRIGIRFAGGQEAEFLHSDIAAVRKPKWYVLGTAGAIVGNWRDATSYEPDPVVYYHRHDYPATEVPPDLRLYRRHASGQMLAQELAVPAREPHGFHRNLADHLLTGEPLVAPLEDSMKVVAILEAAARSAGRGGAVEAIDG